MKVKDIAFIGLGIGATILYQKYASKIVEDAFNMIANEVDKVTYEINQMM